MPEITKADSRYLHSCGQVSPGIRQYRRVKGRAERVGEHEATAFVEVSEFTPLYELIASVRPEHVHGVGSRAIALWPRSVLGGIIAATIERA